MKQPIQFIELEKIKSKWYKDITKEWNPDRNFIDFIKTQLKNGGYIAPVVVVKEMEHYYLVNGHHRYLAHLEAGQKKIKCIVIEGTFDESEPLRKAEVLLKEFDQKTGYKYQFSGYLDRWAALAEDSRFINKYRPTYKFRLRQFLKKLLERR